MEFFFNELSINENLIKKDYICSLFDVVKKSNEKRVRTCRISPDDYKSLFDVVCRDFDKNYINLFMAYFKSPYESDEVENFQDEYLSHKWKFEDVNCFGLALSFIVDTIAISYDGKDTWKKSYLEISCDDEIKTVRNASNGDNFDIHLEYLDLKKPVEIIKTEIIPSKKKIKLADDHHGKDKLFELAKRLINSPYVVSIINSEDNSRYDRRFIKKVFSDGKIRIVLPWTDDGYSMVIQTTGRNLRETKEIGRLLEEQYGRV